MLSPGFAVSYLWHSVAAYMEHFEFYQQLSSLKIIEALEYFKVFCKF